MDYRQKILLDMLRNARASGLLHIPKKLQSDFKNKIFSDAILEGSSFFLFTESKRHIKGESEAKDMFEVTQYLIGFFHGMLRLNDYNLRIEQNGGNTDLVVEEMRKKIELISFWTDRKN